MPPQLPGFYYDETKRKYFKILANHQAPEGASYTRDDVSRRNDKTAESKRATTMAAREAKERVRRSPVLTSPLYRVIEEIGHRYISPEELKDRRARQSVHHLEADLLLPLARAHEFCYLLDFFRDPRSGALIRIANNPDFSEGLITYPDSAKTSDSPRFTYHDPVKEFFFGTNCFEMTAAALNTSGHLLLAPLEERESTLHVQNIIEPDRIGLTSIDMIPMGGKGGLCRAIASERTGYIRDFAIAATDGLKYLAVRPTGYEFDTCWGVKGSGIDNVDVTTVLDQGYYGPRERHSELDTFAVDFITPNLIASGGAGEKVLLTDKRQSDTFTVGIFHSGPISEIKALNDHHLVVSGLNGTATGRSSDNKTICLYDLRNRKKVNGQTATCWEKPATFTGSLPKFEVCPDLGLLALVDKERVPRLVSLKDGTPVQSSISQMGDARRVKFDHCNGHLTLLVSSQQGEVTEYS